MKHSRMILGLAGVVIFAALLWHFDPHKIWQNLTHLDRRLFSLALLFVAMGQVFGFSKWVVMKRKTLPDASLPTATVYASVLVSGMLTPARSGDILASFAWPAYQGKILAWSVMNRILEGGMTILLSIFILGFFFTTALSASRWIGFGIFSLIAFGGVTLLFNREFGMYFLKRIKRLLERLKEWPLIARILLYEEHIETQVSSFYITLKEMRAAHALGYLVFLTLAARVCTIGSNFFLLRALGAQLTISQILGILAITWISGFFAPTPNGLGVGDLPPSLLLARLGYETSAGGFIVMNRLTEILIILFWAGIWMLPRKKNILTGERRV